MAKLNLLNNTSPLTASTCASTAFQDSAADLGYLWPTTQICNITEKFQLERTLEILLANRVLKAGPYMGLSTALASQVLEYLQPGRFLCFSRQFIPASKRPQSEEIASKIQMGIPWSTWYLFPLFSQHCLHLLSPLAALQKSCLTGKSDKRG